MAALDIARTRELLHQFDFKKLFIEALGWSNPADDRPFAMGTEDLQLQRRQIAELSGVVVFEITSTNGIPDAKSRAAVQKEIAQYHHENL